MNKISRLILFLMALGFFAPAARAFQNPLALSLGNHTFIVPFKTVDATQLYSFVEGKGFPALQTTVYNYRDRFHASIGAAPVIGTSNAVPFLGAQVLLSKGIFDPAVGPIWLGAWAGRQFKNAALNQPDKTLWGLNASVALW